MKAVRSLSAAAATKENLGKLLDGEVDYVLADDLLVRHLAERYADRVEESLEIGTKPMITRSLHFALRKALPGAEVVINNFNREIQAMVADGTYNEILQLNWIHADVDGDGKFELVLGPDTAGLAAPDIGYALFAANMPEPGSGAEARYYIDGQIYQGWQNVPERYKIPMDSTPKHMKRGLTVLEMGISRAYPSTIGEAHASQMAAVQVKFPPPAPAPSVGLKYSKKPDFSIMACVSPRIRLASAS